MTAPVLAYKKFYIIKPAEGTNQIKNPQFSGPEYVTGWAASGAGVTIASHPDDARRGAYSMKVNTATGVASGAYHPGLTVTDGDDYTFSCDVKGVAGQAMRIYIANVSGTAKATTTFTATGYWQRVSVSHAAAETATNYRVYVIRDAVASTAAFYVDGAQFEQASAATTLIEGYIPGCRWEGYARNSASIRSAQYGLGGEIVDLEDYCHIVQVTGLGHGDWNQILTKMTSGGDMYQTHIRKSRNFSIIVDFTGNSLSEIESNRKAVLDLIRPDYLFGESEERRIVRYQGVDVNGDEATNPVDIVCVPLSASMVDTPDLPTYQRAILNFTVPSGLLQGAYNEGKELDLYANFPAEFIVKRDKDGNWCRWTGSAYESLIEEIPATTEYKIIELEDGTIISPHGVSVVADIATINYLDSNNEWQGDAITMITGPYLLPISEITVRRLLGTGPNNTFYLFVRAKLPNLTYLRFIISITKTGSTTFAQQEWYLRSADDEEVYCIAYDTNGDLYVGGDFDGSATNNIEKFVAGESGNEESAVGAGLNNTVRAMAFAPNGDLYIGGDFTNTDYPYLCKWDGSAFSPVGNNTDINGAVHTLAFGATGYLYAGGAFTDAGGNAGADYIAKWNGSQWESLGSGTNGIVRNIVVNSGKVYASGDFTSAGGLTLTDRVAVWSNGAWQPLDIDLPGDEMVTCILPAKDGSLYLVGSFSTAAEDPDENAYTGVVALNLNVASASANTYPFMQVHGPGTLKSIVNYSTGKSIMFDGLTLNAGEWINLFFDPLNLIFQGGWSGRGNLMRYVVPGSDYGDFYLKPGNNLISLFFPDSDENLGSGAFISRTPLFWGIDGALL